MAKHTPHLHPGHRQQLTYPLHRFRCRFSQADIKTDIFKKFPTVTYDFTIPDLPSPSDRVFKCYKLLKHLYGFKDADRAWNHYLCSYLLQQGWK